METIYLKGQQFHSDVPICSAIGFFDGLHIGHMALVNEVIRVANNNQYKKALITFDHSPAYVLGYVNEERYLTSMEDRQVILEELGFDYLFIIEFTKEIAALSPEDFVFQYLIQSHVQHVVCGFDFYYGCRNKGNIETLKAYNEFETSVIDEVMYKNKKISSTRIRDILKDGDITEMNALLGRKYCVQGKVIKGRQIGHSIGFPTANIDYQSYFLPCGGVYAVKVRLLNQEYMGMCNIGLNPTFQALERTSLEVYIFDFNEDIYGENMVVEFYEFIRKEQPFDSKDDLIKQLNSDQKAIRQYFSSQL